MIHLSKRLFYAVEAVLYIAYNGVQDPVSGKEIAAKQGQPPRYLEQMLQALVRAGILKGVRGPHGGYQLAREKRKITLADICDVFDTREGPPVSTPLGNDIVGPAIALLELALEHKLREVTLADLYDKASDRQIRKRDDDRNDFII